MKYQIFGGENEIGGNKILLEADGSRIFLDFGLSFAQQNKYYSEFLQPRKGNALRDYFEMGLLPKISGVYRKDYLNHMGLKPGKTSVDAVLISHAHIDHIGCVDFLRSKIPLYCSEATQKIMTLFDETGSNTELVTFKPAFKYYKNKSGGFSRLDARKKEGTKQRRIKLFKFNKPFRVGDLLIHPFQVDHSLPGATAYVIETSEGCVVYTGDLRFHGRNKEKTEYFVEKAAEFEPELMFCEGTRVEEKTSKSEEWVEKEASKLIRGNTGLVVVTYPMRDLDRLLTFYNIAKQNDRELVVDFKQAKLLELFTNMDVIPKLRDVRVYAQPKGWFLINKNNPPEGQIEKDYLTWERKFLNLPNIILTDEVRQDQSHYVFYCSNYQLGNLIDLQPVNGSIQIRSLCEPFDDEMRLDDKRVGRWYEHFNMKRYQLHCSGHASGPDLKKMIRTIKPKKLVPVHTSNPKLLLKFIGK